MRKESTPLDPHSDMNVRDEERDNATSNWWKPYDTSFENVGSCSKKQGTPKIAIR